MWLENVLYEYELIEILILLDFKTYSGMYEHSLILQQTLIENTQ